MHNGDVSEMRRMLGLTDAPTVRAGLAAACEFFRDVIHANPAEWVDYFRGIDFHSDVYERLLEVGTPLARHVSTGTERPKPFVYFTVPGTSPTSTGTTFNEVRFERGTVLTPVPALVSVAAAISFNNMQRRSFDHVSRVGGGTQYIIARRHLAALSLPT